jgi:hypothetical protein
MYYNGKLARKQRDRFAGITRIELDLPDGVRLSFRAEGRLGTALGRVRIGTYLRVEVDGDDPRLIVMFWVAA